MYSLGGNIRTKPFSNQIIDHNSHLPVINLPPRENQIAPNKLNLTIHKSLYRPHFKAPNQSFRAPNHNQNDIYNHKTNYHTRIKLKRNFKFLLSKIQNWHRYQMQKNRKVPVNTQPLISVPVKAQPLISPVVIDPVIQMDQEASKFVFDFKMNNS